MSCKEIKEEMSVKLCWMDTETSGLDSNRNGVIQLAVIIDVDCGMSVERKEFLMRPEGEIDEEALAVSGFTRKQIAGFQSEKVVQVQIKKFFMKYVSPYDKSDYFIPAGFNVQFDLGFLAAMWKRQQDNFFYAFFRSAFDVASMVGIWKWMRYINPTLKYKLEDIAKLLNIKVEGFHNAVVDIEVTREIAYKLREMKIQKRRVIDEF